MKVREVIKRLQAEGWYLSGTRGSHRQFKHRAKPGLVTVAGNRRHAARNTQEHLAASGNLGVNRMRYAVVIEKGPVSCGPMYQTCQVVWPQGRQLPRSSG